MNAGNYNFGKPWTQKEDQILKDFYHQPTDISKLLPKRSRSSIWGRANVLGLKKDAYNVDLFEERLKKLTSEELAYIAGLFDGEGLVQIVIIPPGKDGHRKNITHKLCVSISNTEFNVISFLEDEIGGTLTVNKRLTEHVRKPLHAWCLSFKKAAIFLKYIFPYLRIKKQQARTAIEFQSKVNYSPKQLSQDVIQERNKAAVFLRELKTRYKYFKDPESIYQFGSYNTKTAVN